MYSAMLDGQVRDGRAPIDYSPKENVMSHLIDSTRTLTIRHLAPVLFLGTWFIVALAWPIIIGH
jgi:hypothetical protein